MSAKKCNYSIKYKPLVLAKRSQATTPEAWEAFRNWVYEKFSNPDVAIALTNTNWSGNDLDVTSRTLTKVPDKIESVRAYFRKSSSYDKCVKDFSDAIVNASIFTAAGEWIDANTITKSGISTLNANLANYKLKLVNDINMGLPSPKSRIFIDFSDQNADQQLTKAINDALSSVDQFSDSLDEDTYQKAYSAYVILKNFNSLLTDKTPFVKIKKEYKDSLQHGVNMYEYTGPNVAHRVSWTQNEHVSAESQYSDLAKILLNYFREVSGDSPIPNTSIGVDGFTSVMNRFKTALFYTDLLKEHRTAFYDGTFDIEQALIDYREKLVHQALSSSYSKESLTTQINKLSGIIHYCFSEDTDDDIQEMFRGMFEKTVPLTYFEYAYNSGEFSKRNLSDYYVNQQVLNLKDLINGQVYTFRKNPNSFRELCAKWSLTVDKSSLQLSKNGLNLYISWQENTGRSSSFDVTYDGNVGGANDSILADFISDLLGVYLPLDNYSVQSAQLNQNGSLIEDFKEIIAMVVAAANKESGFSAVTQQNILDFKKMFLFTRLSNAAITLSAIYGTESRNVVTDINGNKLPTNGLTSLVQNAHKLGAELASLDTSDYENPYKNNPLVPRKDGSGNYTNPGFGQPIIRQGIKIKGKTKSVSQLSLAELLEVGITYDFLDSLGSDTLFLQNGNFADKERHWIIPYNVRAGITIDGNYYDTKTLIEDCAKTGDSKTLQEVWRQLRASRYNAIAANILKDYNSVLGTNFKTLKELDAYLIENKYNIDQLRALFRSANVNFKEEVHATKTDGIARVNEVLLHYQECFNNPKLAERRLAKSRAYFAKDIFKSRLRLNRYGNDAVKRRWNDIPDSWKQKRSGVETGNLILFKVYDSSGNEININSSTQEQITNPKNKIILNPILEAYLLADVIYSNEFNQICTGDVFAHPNKKKSGSTEDNGWGSSDYYDFSEASRLIAANKRAVIYGGAIHSFSHDLYKHRGTEKRIKTAVISDPKSPVWTLTGGLDDKNLDDSQDVFDGSGLQSIYQAIFEQQSLKDAAAGFDEKTILGHVDKYFGGQRLLKWAVYALTNERRRLGRNSKISVEDVFRKMHSITFNANLDISKLWSDYVKTPLYYYDVNTGKNYRLFGVEKVGENQYVKRAIACDESGESLEGAEIIYLDNENKLITDTTDSNKLVYNTIYSLDQLFGGAYEKSLVNGKLQYTTNGNYIVADIMCDNQERFGLKQNFISYIVNTSAMKVGAENVNPTERYNNNEALDYMEMSTEYGGLQMNAEHELEDSEVTEMTQMISALIEKGFSSELVNKIYNDIGSTVLESLKKFKGAIEQFENNPEQLRIILGKALVEAYSKGDRDTLGLAQSFLMKAQRMLKDSNIDFKFPFSGATITGSFVSTVASLLTKKGIRRKYAGVAAVLTPSHDMITVYGDGKNFESYAKELRDWRNKNPNFSNVSVDDLINKIYIEDVNGNVVLNPFIILDSDRTFDFEDTIVIEDKTGNLVDIRIDSLEKFYTYKFDYTGNIYKFTSRPRNLKASNTTFNLNGKTRSIFELTSIRAANAAHKKNWTASDEDLIFNTLAWIIPQYNEGNEGEIIAYKDVYNPKYGLVKQYVAERNRIALNGIIDINRTFYNIVQKQLSELNGEDPFVYDPILTGETAISVTDVTVEPAEIILGKMWAKQFHLQAGDDVQDILQTGPQFFEDRLQKDYQLPTDVSSEQFDAIVWTSDRHPILVKIDKNLEYNFDKSRNTNITRVDGVSYLNEKELTDIEDVAFYSINGLNKQYDVVVFSSVEDFYKFAELQSQYKLNYNSDQISKFIENIDDSRVFNFVNDDGQLVATTAQQLKQWPRENIAAIVRRIEEYESQQRIKNQSNRMFESFKLSLQAVGTRIPSQAMQSFQPMKIIAFTDSETNDVYVNRFNFYLEGSDLDIDKTYILTYQVNESGEIETGSKLSRIFGIEKALELELPTGKRFEINAENAQVITLEQAIAINNKDVNVINQVLNGSEHVIFEDSVNEQTRNRVLRWLNLHESSKVTEDALKNRVVHNIRKVVLDPRNQLNLFSPINMDTQRAAADKSDLGRDEKNISIDVPSSKYMMQEQNMVGKQCIGITAVSIKTFFAKSSYYNQIFKDIPKMSDEMILSTLSSLTFENPINHKLSILANINIKDVIEDLPLSKRIISGTATGLLAQFNTIDGRFNLYGCLRYLQRVSNRVDAAMELSGLLSASTDNAKELLLSKINATARFIDVFTVALQCGVTFDEISDLMMSPMFNYIARLAANNIFKPYQGSYKVETAINFYLGQALLPGVRKGLLLQVIQNVKGLSNINDNQLYTLLKDNTVVEALLKKSAELLSIRRNQNLSDDGYDLEEGEVYTTSDYLGLQDFLEEVLDRNITIATLEKEPNYQTQRHNIELILNTFVPATEEQQILGAMLGINQGLPNSAYEQYSYIKRIENFVTKRIGEDFDLMRFIKDSEYAEEMRRNYEDKKSFINILDVIKTVPHFAEMFNSLYDNNFILTGLSARYDLQKELANKLNKNYTLSEAEFRQVGYYINDLMLVSYLTSRGIKIHIPDGIEYYSKTRSGSPTISIGTTVVDIDSLYGLASFKSWFENYVIPALKSRKTDKIDYTVNPFIRNLSRAVKLDSRTGKQQSYYQLPLNMNNIEGNAKSKILYENILSGFNAIANDTFEGHKISDLFFIYNCIVNKDSVGTHSMTRLFEDLVDTPANSSFVSGYYDFISSIDQNIELREQFRQKSSEIDAAYYIKTFVQNTHVNSTRNIDNYGSDFTYRMPTLLGDFEANKVNVSAYSDEESKYQFRLTGKDTLQGVLDFMKSKYPGKIIDHSSNWFERHKDEFGNDQSIISEPAFIYDGIVYINTDYADMFDALHEFTHLILAALKFNEDDSKKALYYTLVKSIKSHPKYNEYQELYQNLGLIGTDLEEEIFAKVIQDYLKNRVTAEFNTGIIESNQSSFIDVIAEIFQSDIPKNVDLMNLSATRPAVLIRLFGSSIFNLDSTIDLSEEVIRWRTETQALRKVLISSGNVKVKCD